MANIETRIRYDLDLTLHIVTGSLSTQELQNKLRSYYEGKPTKVILWDFSNGSWGPDIDGTQFRLIMSKFKDRASGKTAFIVPTDHGFGLSRVLDTLVSLSRSEVEFRSFRDTSSAYAWLGFDEIPSV